MSDLVDGDFECGLHFGFNLFWGEVTGQKSSAQHTIKTAIAGQPVHSLLIQNQKDKTREPKY